MVKKQKEKKAGSATATPKTRSPAKRNNLVPPTAITPDEDVQAAEQKRAQLEENLWTIEKQVGMHVFRHPVLPDFHTAIGFLMGNTLGFLDKQTTECDLAINDVQIYELETRYLEQSNLRGNAVRGMRQLVRHLACPGPLAAAHCL